MEIYLTTKFTFILVSKDGYTVYTKVVYATDYLNAVNQLSFYILELGDIIHSFTEEHITIEETTLW